MRNLASALITPCLSKRIWSSQLEPGIYFKDRWGLRLESVIRITRTGAEVLSKFQHKL